MLRKVFLVFALLGLAGAASAQQELVVNGSFEDGLTGWTQATLNSEGTFESVANGGSHTIFAGCTAPAGFPGSGDFWSVSCQDDEDVHVLYQDVFIPEDGAVLTLVGGVDMCSVPGGCFEATPKFGGAMSAPGDAGSFWNTDKGLFSCPSIPFKGGAEKGDPDSDCVRIDIVHPGASVLDPLSGILLPIASAVNADATPGPSPVIDLSDYNGTTIRFRLWVQAASAPVALQADVVSIRAKAGIPALQPLGLALLALVLGGVGLLARRRRRN